MRYHKAMHKLREYLDHHTLVNGDLVSLRCLVSSDSHIALAVRRFDWLVVRGLIQSMHVLQVCGRDPALLVFKVHKPPAIWVLFDDL